MAVNTQGTSVTHKKRIQALHRKYFVKLIQRDIVICHDLLVYYTRPNFLLDGADFLFGPSTFCVAGVIAQASVDFHLPVRQRPLVFDDTLRMLNRLIIHLKSCVTH